MGAFPILFSVKIIHQKITFKQAFLHIFPRDARICGGAVPPWLLVC